MTEAASKAKADGDKLKTDLTQSVEDSQKKAATEVTQLKKDVAAFQCDKGQFYDVNTKKCGPSMLHMLVRLHLYLTLCCHAMHVHCRGK